ncbi:MAG: peptidylprolyl isomerase, partial [Alphaproteobacteria bacterium]
RARHILVGTEDEAKDLIDQLNEGAVFADLAAEFSVGPSGPRGGDLGFFNQGQMVEPFAVAAFALQPGEVYATPVETQFGWHVIKVEERRMTEQPSLEDLRSQLESGLADDVIQGIFAELRDGAEIVVYGPDGEPMEN